MGTILEDYLVTKDIDALKSIIENGANKLKRTFKREPVKLFDIIADVLEVTVGYQEYLVKKVQGLDMNQKDYAVFYSKLSAATKIAGDMSDSYDTFTRKQRKDPLLADRFITETKTFFNKLKEAQSYLESVCLSNVAKQDGPEL